MYDLAHQTRVLMAESAKCGFQLSVGLIPGHDT